MSETWLVSITLALAHRIHMSPLSYTSPMGNSFEHSTSFEVFSLENIIQTAAKLENLLKDSFIARPHHSSLHWLLSHCLHSVLSPLNFLKMDWTMTGSMEYRFLSFELAKVPHNSVSDIMDLQKRLCQTVTNNYLQQWTFGQQISCNELELVQR